MSSLNMFFNFLLPLEDCFITFLLNHIHIQFIFSVNRMWIQSFVSPSHDNWYVAAMNTRRESVMERCKSESIFSLPWISQFESPIWNNKQKPVHSPPWREYTKSHRFLPHHLILHHSLHQLLGNNVEQQHISIFNIPYNGHDIVPLYDHFPWFNDTLVNIYHNFNYIIRESHFIPLRIKRDWTTVGKWFEGFMNMRSTIM